MSDGIVKREAAELRTWDGKRVRTSKAELYKALAPMFVAFPGLEMGDETFNAYHMMLADLDPDKLARAVMLACQAHKYPTQLITVAAIREMYEGVARPPNEEWDKQINVDDLPPLRTKMFRLPEDEDRAERLARLKKYQRKGESRYG